MIESIIISEMVESVVQYTILGFLLGMIPFIMGLGITSSISILSMITKNV